MQKEERLENSKRKEIKDEHVCLELFPEVVTELDINS